MSRSKSAGWLRTALLLLLGLFSLFTLLIGFSLANPSVLKPVISYFAESLTDRSLSIDGEIALDLSMQPSVTAWGVRYGNAAWSAEPEMISAEFIKLRLDIMALFDHRLHIIELQASGGLVHLEDRVDGQPNWRLFQEDALAQSSDWAYFIEALELEDVIIRAEVGDLEPVLLEIVQLTESSDPQGNLQLAGSGSLNSEPWRLNGVIGTLQELLIAGHINMNLELMLADAEIDVAGSIGQLADLAALDLKVDIYGPDADLLGEIFGLPEAFQNDIALAASITPEATGHAIEITGHVSDFDMAAAGTVLDLNNLDGWDMDIHIEGPEAEVFSKSLQLPGLPEGPFEISGRLHLHGGDLDLTNVAISNAQLNLLIDADFADFPRRAGAFGSIRISGPELGQFRQLLKIPTLPDVPFDLQLNLDATGSTAQASLEVGSNVLTAEGFIGEFPSFKDTRLTTTIRGDDVARILRLVRIEDSLSGPYQAAALIGLDGAGLTATDVSFESGPLQLSGEGRLPDFTELKQFSLSGGLNVSDLALAGEDLGLEGLPAHSAAIHASIQSSDTGFQALSSVVEYQGMRLQVDGSLGNGQSIAGIDLNVAIEGPDIAAVFDDALTRENPIPFTLKSRVRATDADAVELIDLVLSGEGGSFNVDARIMLREDMIGSHFSIAGRGRNLAGFLPQFPYYQPPVQPWEVAADFRFPDADHLGLEQSYLKVGSIQITATGMIDPKDQTGTDLFLESSGDSLVEIGRVGEVQLPDIPFDLAIKLDGTKNTINVTSLTAHWADSDLRAEGSINLDGKPAVVLKGNSSTMILDDLQKAIFGEPEDLDPSDDLEKIFPDTPILLDDLQQFDADIDIQIGEFRGIRTSLNDVDLLLNIKDGELLIDRVAYRDQTGSFDVQVLLSPREGDQVHLDLTLVGKDADIGLFTSPDQAPETIPRYTLDVAIEGDGRTVAELVGSLSGRALISSGGGRVDNDQMETFTGDFLSNVFELLNPFSDTEPFTPMECMVVNATLEDGKVDLKPGFVMRTDRVNMFVYGNVDLKSERIDLSLATQARRGIGISAASITNPYFKVGGTLAKPALQLDAASAALAASVATVTAGLSIVVRGVWERLMGETNPCPRFLKQDQKTSDQTTMEDAGSKQAP